MEASVEDEKKCFLNHFNLRGYILLTIIPKGLHLFDDVL
jgi:hypothetical protein